MDTGIAKIFWKDSELFEGGKRQIRMKRVEQVVPYKKECKNCIVFASNDFFSPYMAVMLQSVIEHSNPERFYDILILHRDIKMERMKKIKGMAEERSNISIRFYDISPLIDGLEFYLDGKETFTADAYSRLLIPEVLSVEYEKALYLDGDMVAQEDVSPLFDIDLKGYLLASSRDIEGIAEYYMPNSARKVYRDKILPGENPNDYFISGMLVLNLQAIRMEFSQKDILSLAISRDWFQHDQDILNVMCKGGRAKILHAAWDVLRPTKPTFLPPILREELAESLAAPKIIHYGGDEKPWKSLVSPWMDEFWDTAIKTPFAKEIIYRILREHPGTVNEIMIKRYETGTIGFRYIVKFFKGWLTFKLKTLRRQTY